MSILDELGRGTATFDGTAIAHAVVEHLVSQIGCRTLFATHYHMLVQDWEMDPRIQLGHMDCMVQSKGTTATTSEEDVVEEVTFLYKLCNGCSPKSYGINVARLAGMPNSVLELALAQSMILEAQINQVPASDAKRAYFEKLQNVLERLVSISHAHTLTLEELVYVASEMWRRYEHLLQSS